MPGGQFDERTPATDIGCSEIESWSNVTNSVWPIMYHAYHKYPTRGVVHFELSSRDSSLVLGSKPFGTDQGDPQVLRGRTNPAFV